MAKERHNINTIAEILIDKIDEVKGQVNRMERISKEGVQVNYSAFDDFIGEMFTRLEHLGNQQEQTAKRTETIAKNNGKFVPNWCVVSLVCLSALSVFLGFALYTKDLQFQDMEKTANSWRNYAKELEQKP